MLSSFAFNINLRRYTVAAANAFPSTVQCIFTCLYGVGTTVRLKAAGMELAVWVLRHTTAEQLQQTAPLLLNGMLKLLDGKVRRCRLTGSKPELKAPMVSALEARI